MISRVNLGEGVGNATLKKAYPRDDVSEHSVRQPNFLLGLDQNCATGQKSNGAPLAERPTFLLPVIFVRPTYSQVIARVALLCFPWSWPVSRLRISMALPSYLNLAGG